MVMIYFCFFIVFIKVFGFLIWDVVGREYFDFMGGIVVNFFGYNDF